MCGIHAIYIKEKGALPLRTLLAILLIIARGGVWVIEQPSSSLVYRHPRFQQMLSLISVTLRHPICWFILSLRASHIKKDSTLASNTNTSACTYIHKYIYIHTYLNIYIFIYIHESCTYSLAMDLVFFIHGSFDIPHLRSRPRYSSRPFG